MNVVETISPGARRVVIGFNPRAGAQNRQAVVQTLCRELANAGLETTVCDDVQQLAELAARSLEAGDLRVVVAAGGDGTVRLIADKTPPGTPLIVLPLGTENLLARYLELPADPARICHIISEGAAVRLDAGAANERLFILMAGCGFDADVVRRLHQSRRGNIHHFSYAKPILDSIRNYDYPELRVSYAPRDAPPEAPLSEHLVARWAFVVNLPRYAGGLSFAPAASGTDGLLDVCTFKEGSLWHGLVYLGGVMFGQHEAMQDFARIQTRRLRIDAAGSAPYQLDGDPGGDLPVEINVLQGRLTMLVSGKWARDHVPLNAGIQRSFG